MRSFSVRHVIFACVCIGSPVPRLFVPFTYFAITCKMENKQSFRCSGCGTLYSKKSSRDRHQNRTSSKCGKDRSPIKQQFNCLENCDYKVSKIRKFKFQIPYSCIQARHAKSVIYSETAFLVWLSGQFESTPHIRPWLAVSSSAENFSRCAAI